MGGHRIGGSGTGCTVKVIIRGASVMKREREASREAVPAVQEMSEVVVE